MSYLRALILLSVFCSAAATADVWMWVDTDGETHYVATDTSIFTWVEDGRVFYSDTPDHEDAIAVQLVWVSKGSVDDMNAADNSDDGYAFPGETPEERAEREKQEAHNCNRATEIYASYKNAPRLYRTNDDGDREYLSKAEARAKMSETKGKVKELCK